MFRTWDGRHLETQVHKVLQQLDRKSTDALGREWFVTSAAELRQLINQCTLSDLPVDRIVSGADETLEEGFAGLMANGGTIGMGMIPGQAAVSIGIRYPNQEDEPSDAPKSPVTHEF